MNPELSGDGRVFVRVDLEDQTSPDHLARKLMDFRSSYTTGATPWRPKVHQDGHLGFSGDFGELRRVHIDRLRDGRQGRFTGTAAAGI